MSREARIAARENWLAESEVNRLAHAAVNDEMSRQSTDDDLWENGTVNWQFNLIALAVLDAVGNYLKGAS